MLAAAEKTAVLTPWNTSDPVAGAIYSALCERHGKKVQEKLDAGFVTICGLGGLGSNIAVSLARIGVGHLRLVDFDNVDWTNLNRQSYFVEHVGVKKTDALKGFLMKINPFLTYETVTARVTPKNLASCVGDATIICEAFDKADQKAMLAREVRCQKPDAYLVSGSGMAGFGTTGLMKVREVSPLFYLCGDSVSAPKPGAGLMAPRVAICSAMMANVVTWLLLGKNGAY